MFKLYKNWLHIIIKKPMNIFWILFFPIILITLFKLTMGNVDSVTSFDEKIKIDYIETNGDILDNQLKSAFDSEELKNYYEINISESKEISQEKVEKNEIDGYFYLETNENNTYTIIAKTGSNSFANSMIRTFLEQSVDTINKYTSLFNQKDGVLKVDYTKNGEKIYKEEKVPSIASLYTFPAIIYSILFTGLIAQEVIRSMSSNMSYSGMRVELATEKKSKIFIAAILATFTIGFICLIFITIYTQALMKIEIGLTTHFGYLMLIYIVGLIVSILLASMIVMLTHKKSKETQNSLLSTVLMLMYFLSGGMVGNLSLIVKKYALPLYYMNPAALLSDSIKYLSYKEDLSIIWSNLGITAISGVIYLVVSVIALRRKKNELY